jgi:hypothetical protein
MKNTLAYDNAVSCFYRRGHWLFGLKETPTDLKSKLALAAVISKLSRRERKERGERERENVVGKKRSRSRREID